jgi:hypothetical protein
MRPKPIKSERWIDAIYLYQDNDEDKAHQIPQIKEIYEQANHAFTELGPAFEEEVLAIDHDLLIARCSSENLGEFDLEFPYSIRFFALLWTHMMRLFGND